MHGRGVELIFYLGSESSSGAAKPGMREGGPISCAHASGAQAGSRLGPSWAQAGPKLGVQKIKNTHNSNPCRPNCLQGFDT